jgi:hypothetical protein
MPASLMAIEQCVECMSRIQPTSYNVLASVLELLSYHIDLNLGITVINNDFNITVTLAVLGFCTKEYPVLNNYLLGYMNYFWQ